MKSSKRLTLLVGALAALLPFGTASVHAATVINPATGISAGMSTGFDQVIDNMVRDRVTAEKLSPADARIAREQMQLQFRSLTGAEQQRLLNLVRDHGVEEGGARAAMVLSTLVQATARRVLAEAQAAEQAAQGNVQAQGIQPKIGGADGDLIFVPTVGPCRIYDSRNGPGQLPSLSARQIYGFSNTFGYNWAFDQGGTGTAGNGNCAGTVHNLPVSNYPIAVVATVGVVNVVTSGSMRAWNGGTTLTVGGILGWNPGDVLANTTVIPMDRNITAYPGSGGKRDFGLFNNSGGPVDIIVDVVGYFTVNQAVALDCQYISQGPSTNVPVGSTVVIAPDACPAGYRQMISAPYGVTYGVHVVRVNTSGCRMGNFSGAVQSAWCDSFCCRVPGK